MNLFGKKWKSSKYQTAIRWLKNDAQRKVELQSFPSYWKLRNQKEKLVFSLRKRLFSIRMSFEDRKEWSSSRFVILKTFLKPFLFSLFVVSAIETAEYFLVQNQPFFRLYLPRNFANIWDWFSQRIDIDVATFRALLGPIITVSGAFIGLYFTALNVLLSSTYKQVTEDVRTLLIRDKVGNVYIQTVAFTGSYSLILLGLATAGHAPGLISLILLVCLGVTEIYCFLNQWFRLFRLFDPSILAYYLQQDLVSLIKEAKIGARWSEDPSFQEHFQNQAESKLGTYRNLITTIKNEEHLRVQSLVKLSNSLLSFLLFYQTQKSRIPSQSRWFKTTYQHKDWITTSYTETSIAERTGTTLSPKEVPDFIWIEKEVIKMLDFALKGFLDKQELSNALALFQDFQTVTKNLARSYSLDETLLLFRIIKINAKEYSKNFKVSKDDIETDLDQVKYSLALVDFYGLSFVNILLGFVESIENIDLETFKNFVEDTNWQDVRSLYRRKFPRRVLQQLEKLKKYIDFERVVEGQVITQRWYLLQILVLDYSRFLESAINVLLAELAEVFIEEATSLIKQKKFILAVQLIQRGFEACNKFEHHFYVIENHCKTLDESQLLKDVPSVNFQWEEYQKKIRSVYEQLIILFSRSFDQIMQLPKTEELPDYFGHAYSVLTNECFSAMANKNLGLFGKLFPATFIACFEAYERLRKLEIVDSETKFGVMADPIIDLFDLSGYSIIFSELDSEKFWSITKSSWDAYLEQKENKSAVLEILLALGSYNSFMMFPRSMIRGGWQQTLERILRERGLMRDDYLYGYSPYESENDSQHSSKLINFLCQHIFLNRKAREIFITNYFKNEMEKEGMEISEEIAALHQEMSIDES